MLQSTILAQHGHLSRVTALEAKLVSAEAANRSLSTRLAAYSETKAVLDDELDDKELEVNRMKTEKLRESGFKLRPS